MQNRIAKVAYELYEKRGRQDGHQEEDWLEAERLVRVQLTKEEGVKKTHSSRPAPRKAARKKEASEETKKKLAKPPARTAAVSKRKKISPEATL